MTSYIQLLNKIEAFCNAHYQIQRYGGEFREQMPNLSTESEKYPIVFVTPTGGTPLYDTNQISLDIYCVDIIQKNRANINTIVSDCHLILTDLYGYFSQGSDLSVDVIGQPSQTPLNNLDLDYVAGWMMTIVFEVNGYCVEAIPMGVIPSGGGECADASYIVEYADGTPIESGTIESGGSVTVVVPDCPTCDSATWTLTDSDGNVLDSGTIPSGGSETIVAPDATVNINGSLWDSVLSGGTENISVRQSTGNTEVGSIQGQYFRIGDSTVENSDSSYSDNVMAEDTLILPDSQINVNGVDQGDVVSVQTIDVNVTDGTNPVTPDAVSLVGNTLTIEVPAGGGGDPDVTAFLTATGITDPTIESALADLVSDLKTNYLWNKISAIYPMVGGTATTHKFNLKDPRDLDAAHRMVFNGGWTHNSDGALSNGSNAYGDTKLNAQFNMTVYNEHLAVYIQENAASGLIGATSNPTDQILQLGGTLYSSLSGGNGNASIAATSGLYLCSRIDTTQSDTYINGVSVFNYSSGITGLGNQNLNYYIASRNDGGTPSFYGANTFSFVSIGLGLDATEQATYYTIIQAFQTALGRNV